MIVLLNKGMKKVTGLLFSSKRAWGFSLNRYYEGVKDVEWENEKGRYIIRNVPFHHLWRGDPHFNDQRE